MRTTFGEMVLEVANDRRNVNDINTVANTAPRKAGSHVSVTSPQATSMLEGAELSAALASLQAATSKLSPGALWRRGKKGDSF